jgi:hypothetical protein
MNVAVGNVYHCPVNEQLIALMSQMEQSIRAFFKDAWSHAKLAGNRFKDHAYRYIQSIQPGKKPKIPPFVRAYMKSIIDDEGSNPNSTKAPKHQSRPVAHIKPVRLNRVNRKSGRMLR